MALFGIEGAFSNSGRSGLPPATAGFFRAPLTDAISPQLWPREARSPEIASVVATLPRAVQRAAFFIAAAFRLASGAAEAKRKTAEQALLLRELDHRFKNVLAMTAALINYQSRYIADPAARSAMETASRRVVALGLVHQTCSHASSGDLGEIIENVCTNLVAGDPRFEMEVDAEQVIVPVHKATVVALILNELVTNAIKHAFHDRERCKITVSLRRTAGALVALSVTDDGAPLVTDIQKPSNGTGLNLIARLAVQLAGELRVDADHKRFTVVFPAHTGQH